LSSGRCSGAYRGGMARMARPAARDPSLFPRCRTIAAGCALPADRRSRFRWLDGALPRLAESLAQNRRAGPEERRSSANGHPLMIEFVWTWVLLALPLPWLVRRLLPPAHEPAAAALR